ncbi:MarR family transcriptional regulator [Zobellella endophytica]|uniref:MarR family transcriptional regulator n=1 Tax=Zobellella endophytica TaxID=2116700 RepID=A0A2P7RBK3_9GAMM|nr:MarR family transcriptional regulator [Zobellella endophytica]PSJ47618.1 MarR family transcriptional regulator [Zobellella endophytica]
MDTPSLQEQLLALLHRFRQAMKQDLSVGESNINAMHILMLGTIGDNAPCTANTIARLTRRDKAQVTRLLKELLAMGLVHRQANPDDKRSHWLHPTAAGSALMQRVGQTRERVCREICRGLSPAEQQQFQHIAGLMLANLDRLLQAPAAAADEDQHG